MCKHEKHTNKSMAQLTPIVRHKEVTEILSYMRVHRGVVIKRELKFSPS